MVTFESEFKRKFSKLDKTIKNKIIKQILKLKNNPGAGKPMRYSRKGTRELYVYPYRLSYIVENEEIYLLDIYHKDEQ